MNKYLRVHAEPEARLLRDHFPDQHYRHCLVIPAYREKPELADRLVRLGEQSPGLLVILVINQPDTETDPHCNDELRDALLASTSPAGGTSSLPAAVHCHLRALSASSGLLLVERPRPLPAREGVGLARKLGCDIACALQAAGKISSEWLHNSDADAHLPPDYFPLGPHTEENAVAVVHPFVHRDTGNRATPRNRLPITLYELRLHYYVLGLRRARSPYAFHTLGSCISVRFAAYQQVRGFPRRAGAEDFYLLNKVAKLGRVSTPTSPLIVLEDRVSDRVPFGTGPALQNLEGSENPLQESLFYHPDSFHALGAVLAAAPALYQCADPADTLAGALQSCPGANEVLRQLGIDGCLRHCRDQGRSEEAFTRHFHQWFDGFRTLKLIHGLRERGYEDMNLRQSLEHPRSIWPVAETTNVEPRALLHACLAHFRWIR